MQPFRDMPINRKLSVLLLLTCATVLLLAGAAMIMTEWLTTRRAMINEMTILADLLANNSTAPLSFARDEDRDEVNSTLSSLSASPNIVAAAVYDAGGKPFGRYLRSHEVAPVPPNAPPAGNRFAHEYLEVTRPIFFERKPIGTIYLRADLERIYGQLQLYATVLGLILLASIVVTLALTPRLRKPIAEPILALAAVARHVAEKKDYAARAQRRSGDEIGLLTDSFNQMLGEIEQGQSSLEAANRSMQQEINERKAIEARLRQTHDQLKGARDAAEAASRAKDQFLAVLSHELRTPLTPVLLTVALLQHRQDLPEEVQADVQIIRRHVELEARLIDDLLDLTRITRGKLQLHFETVDVHVLLRDAVKICCGERPDDVRVALDAQRHHVRADPGRLLQVFWNLLNNACKFTPAGSGIDVRTCNVDGSALQIEVVDHGVGIEPAALPKIFDAFEQAGAAGSIGPAGSQRGLGLGLAIVKALVDLHRGTIEAKSEGKNAGSTFRLTLATVSPPPTATSTAPPPSTALSPHDGASKPSPHSPPSLPSAGKAFDGPGSAARPAISCPAEPSLRILVVEDHPGTLELLQALLNSKGHAVRPADSVQAAMRIAQSEPLDLVISDLGLPDGSGWDLMAQLRRQHGLRGICLSGFGMDSDIERSVEAGFSQHLIKPVDPGELLSAIRQAVAAASPPGNGSG